MPTNYSLLSLELTGYTRIALSGISRFTLKPISSIQLILGSNGSGKSSLMEELFPLPAHTSNFDKNGSKIHEWLLDGKLCRLESVFTNGSQKHAFYLEDMTKNLNPGGTLTVQRQLVKEYFNIDSEIQALMLGTERFTDMSPTRRREWFTRMGENNFDYVLSRYRKAKELHRDVSGALKMAKFTLVDEVAKRLKPEEIERLRVSIAEGKQQLSVAIRSMSKDVQDPARTQAHHEAVRQQYLDSVRKTAAYAKKAMTWTFGHNAEQLEPLIHKLNGEQKHLNAQLAQLNAEYLDIEGRVHQLRRAGVEDVKNIQNTTQVLQADIAALTERLSQRELIEALAVSAGAKHITSAIEGVETYLRDLSTKLPTNADRRYSRAREDQYLTRQRELLAVKDQKLKALDQWERVIKEHTHLRDHAQTQCPKCKHAFSQGFSATTLAHAETQFEQLEAQMESLNAELQTLDNQIQACQEYAKEITLFARVLSPEFLQPLKHHIAQHWLFTDPAGIGGLLDKLKMDLIHYEAILECQERLEMLTALSKNEDALQSNSISFLMERLAEITKQTDACSIQLATCSGQIRHYTEMLECVQELTALVNASRQLEQDLWTSFEAHTTASLDRVWSHYIYELESSLASQESALRAIDIREAYIAEVEKDIVKYQQQEKAYGLLVDALSPTEGIIADSLHGFMNAFVGQMNQFIDKIWTYPLTILATQPDSEDAVELNYRFPFSVKDAKPLPDVSIGSRGMKEIFDLAFRMIAAQHLGLGVCPLFLDEFGSSFDQAHRPATTHAINSLMNHQVFSQLFMVSHYEDSYLPLSDADICVLSDLNVVVPVSDRVNHHVTME